MGARSGSNLGGKLTVSLKSMEQLALIDFNLWLSYTSSLLYINMHVMYQFSDNACLCPLATTVSSCYASYHITLDYIYECNMDDIYNVFSLYIQLNSIVLFGLLLANLRAFFLFIYLCGWRLINGPRVNKSGLRIGHVGWHQYWELRSSLDRQKFCKIFHIPVTSNLWTHA